MTARRQPRRRAAPPMPPECRDRLDQTFAWLDDELVGAEAREVARHVASCPFCGGLTDDLRRAIATCRAAGDCRVPQAVHRHARARAKALIRGKRQRGA